MYTFKSQVASNKCAIISGLTLHIGGMVMISLICNYANQVIVCNGNEWIVSMDKLDS